MTVLKNVFVALFRPAKGVDGVAAALKWLWIPLAVLLLVSVVAKAAVATPLQLEASAKLIAEEMAKSQTDTEAKDGEIVMPDEVEMPDEADMAAGNKIVATSALVFAVLGALGTMLVVAVYFFVAAKTWANPVAFSTMLSVAGLGLIPRAIGNFVQAAYMSASGVWIQHSGLGALVAPAKVSDPPGIPYAFLQQIDVWAVWGVAILGGALLAAAVGFDRKRALTSMIVFVVGSLILRAVPTIAVGALMGGS